MSNFHSSIGFQWSSPLYFLLMPSDLLDSFLTKVATFRSFPSYIIPVSVPCINQTVIPMFWYISAWQVKNIYIEALESTILEAKRSCPIYYTEMAPTHFLSAGDTSSIISLNTLCNSIVLCISGIGCADSFIQRMKMVLPTFICFFLQYPV